MADPEAQLMAEAAAGVPAAPTPSTLPPEPVGQPGGLAPTPLPGPAAPVVPSKFDKFAGWMRRQWEKLTTPTQHKPSEYRDRRLAIIVNHELDEGAAGPAHTAELGESVSLVVDHLMHGRGGAQTPIGHLGGSTMEYAWIVWDTGRRPDMETQPEPPKGAQDQRQAFHPAAPTEARVPSAGDSEPAVERDPSKASKRKVATKARRKR